VTSRCAILAFPLFVVVRLSLLAGVTRGAGMRACQATGWAPSTQMKRDAPSNSLPHDANGARPSTTQWSSACRAAVQNCNIVCAGRFSGTALG
jgi:hypothetical protein